MSNNPHLINNMGRPCENEHLLLDWARHERPRRLLTRNSCWPIRWRVYLYSCLLLGHNNANYRGVWRLQRIHLVRIWIPNDRRVSRNRCILMAHGVHKHNGYFGKRITRHYRQPYGRSRILAIKHGKSPNQEPWDRDLQQHQTVHRAFFHEWLR